MSLRRIPVAQDLYYCCRRARPLLTGNTSTKKAFGLLPKKEASSIVETKSPTLKLARYQITYAFFKEAANIILTNNAKFFGQELGLFPYDFII